MSITIQIIILVIVNYVKHILSAMLNNSSNLFLQYETHQKPEEFYNEKAEDDHSKKADIQGRLQQVFGELSTEKFNRRYHRTLRQSFSS